MHRQNEGFVQNDIIEKLNRFALENGLKQVSTEGICDTLTMLYILAKQDGFAADYLLELDDMVRDVDLPDKPETENTPSKEWLLFIKYINLAIFFQDNKQKYLPKEFTHIMNSQYALNMLSSAVKAVHMPEGDVRYTKEHAVPIQVSLIEKINLNKDELIRLIKILALPNYQLKLNSANYENDSHTIEIEFNGVDYIFFDSNFPDFVTKFSDINVLANEIIQANFLEFSSNFFPIEIQIFSRQPIPEFDRTGFIKQIMAERKKNGLYNRETYDGTTQLFNAIDTNDIATIMVIIRSGADTIDYKIKQSHRKLTDNNGNLLKVHPTTGMNAITYALAQGKIEMAGLLVNNVRKDDSALMNKTVDGKNLLMYALEYGRWGFAIQILDKLSHGHPLISEESNNAKSPLLLAIEARNLDLVKLLIAKGADVNQVSLRSSAAVTPLLRAIELNDDQDNVALIEDEAKSIEIIECLVEAGANINLSDSRINLSHPLRVALDEGNIDAARLILHHPQFNRLLSGVYDLNLELEKAYKEGKFKLVLFLLENDLKPLHYPVDGEYLEALLYGYSTELNDADSERYKVVSLLFNTADMRAQDKKGNTALHYALRSQCSLDLVQALLAHNPDIVNIANYQEQNGPLLANTALSIVLDKLISSVYEEADFTKFNYYADALRLLLKHRVDPDSTQSCNNYLTQHCVGNGNYDQQKIETVVDILNHHSQQIQIQRKEHLQREAHQALLGKKNFILHNKWQYTLFRGHLIEGKDAHDKLVKNVVPKSVKESIFPVLANVGTRFNPNVDYTKILREYYKVAGEAAKTTRKTRKSSTQKIYEQESKPVARPDGGKNKHEKGQELEHKRLRQK